MTAHTEKKISVIIGGGNGIGEACCRLMAEKGWKVAVADYDGAAAKCVAESIGATAHSVDVRDLDSIESVAVEIERNVGPVSSLIVAAGAFQERYEPQDFPADTYRNVLAVNIEGTFNCCQVFGTRMAHRREGNIVNIASHAAHCGLPLHAYGPSKAAVINLTRNLAGEWGRAGVRVNSVSPGPTLVPRVLARSAGRYAANINDHIALGRRIQPREIAEGVAFLASDCASAITGTDLLIDAGVMAAAGWGLYGGVPQH